MPAPEVLATVKARLQITHVDLDGLINSYITEIQYRIQNYCNIDAIPVELEMTWTAMTIDIMRLELTHVDEINQTTESTELTIGDTTIKPSRSPSLKKSAIDSIVTNYQKDLKRFRKLRW